MRRRGHGKEVLGKGNVGEDVRRKRDGRCFQSLCSRRRRLDLCMYCELSLNCKGKICERTSAIDSASFHCFALMAGIDTPRPVSSVFVGPSTVSFPSASSSICRTKPSPCGFRLDMSVGVMLAFASLPANCRIESASCRWSYSSCGERTDSVGSIFVCGVRLGFRL